MKLKVPEDLEQYSLKNFDLEAFQLAQQQPEPAPIPEAPSPPIPQPYEYEQSFSPAPNPVQTEPYQPAPAPCDVQFGMHFNLQQPLYMPPSPSQSWKMPRWVFATVGLFFGSAVVLMIVLCVALLRDPKPAVAEQPAVPVAAVATTSPAPPAPPVVSPPVTRAPSAPVQATTAKRIVVSSRQPSVVRRQVYRTRRVASRSASASLEPQETETAPKRPPKDALDQLLGESAL